MVRSRTDEEREYRITYEIIVDCYDEYEVSMGWYTYLLDHLNFPLKAQWTNANSLEGLTEQKSSRTQTVRVIGMSDSDDCPTDMLVDIEYGDGSQTDIIAVPLSELQLADGDEDSIRAFEDWQYWLAQGNQLANSDEDQEY